MKKSLLALAVLGAFAGVASAQSNVTMYGLIDTGIVVSDDGDERTTQMYSGIAGASRWGIKGSEDLGNGLKAHFVLEAGINSDDGSSGSAGFSRLSYVGLDGGFGTLRLGRQDTAMKNATGKIDPFGAAGMNNAHDYLLGGIDQRRANQLTYLTPKMGGFDAGVYYNFGEQPGSVSEQSNVGLRVGYNNGPLHAQIVHENLGDENGLGNDQKDTLVGGAYDFGVATLHAAYATRSVDAGDDIRSGMLGVSAKLGSGKVMANFTRVENRDTDNADSDVIGLGYNYSLSKRTTLTARYVRVNNDGGAQFGATGGDFPASAAGEDASAFGVGIQHKF